MKKFVTVFSKVYTMFAVILVLSSATAFAQTPLNVTSDQFAQVLPQMASIGQTQYRDTSANGLQALVNMTGENQTWSFQAFSFMLDTSGSSTAPSSVVAYPGGAALADSFPTATHVIISNQGGGLIYYSFIRLDATGLFSLGASGKNAAGAQSILGTQTPPQEIYAFPLTYQTSWSNTSTGTLGGYSHTQVEDNLVDGWGSFILPGNISTQSLRIKTRTSDSTPTVIYTSPFGNDTIPGYTTVSYSYQWFSLSPYSAYINADSNQIATDANYDVPGAQNTVLNNPLNPNYSISLGANPVSSTTNVSFTMPSESQVRISLMDPLGRESQVLMSGIAHPGMNILPLDPTNLIDGTYFLRIQSAGYSNVQKIIVSH